MHSISTRRTKNDLPFKYLISRTTIPLYHQVWGESWRRMGSPTSSREEEEQSEERERERCEKKVRKELVLVMGARVYEGWRNV